MVPNNKDSSDYQEILRSGVPLLDVRAPLEFSNGAFPSSVNIPLLDDDQRAAVGTRYKQDGQQAAIDLGWSLATPAIKQSRLQEWSQFVEAHPQGYLYCFRGGLRSRIAQQLIAEAGYHYPRIIGGYKAMRQFLLTTLDSLSTHSNFIVVAGPACSGKTRLLHELPNSVDLEQLAHHRGSAFGGQITEQPSQIDFENALAIALLRQLQTEPAWVFIEDEGKLIGRCSLPPKLKQALRLAPRVLLNTPFAERVEIGMQDYVVNRLQEIKQFYADDYARHFSEFLLQNLSRIKKRLGGERYSEILAKTKTAIHALVDENSIDLFPTVIERLLRYYYDPMYNYQHKLNSGNVLFEGDLAAVRQWAMRHCQQTTLPTNNTISEVKTL